MSETDYSGTPFVSIVIPAYNAAGFIDRTVASAIGQSYRYIEVIVVDDGSTDDTASRVERCAARDSRIRLTSVANGGVARARNIGIAAARGMFVAFLDADDLWHRDKIRLQVDCIVNSPVWLGGCYALSRFIDVDDRVISDGPRLVAEGYVLARRLTLNLFGNGSCLLVRREIALSLGGYDPSYADRQMGGCEDMDFELKLTARYLVGVVPHYLVGYRKSPGNMSSDRVRMTRAMRATVATHLALNPGLPRRIRRIAWTRVYEYHIWNNLRERRLATSLIAVAKLAALDIAKTIRVLGEIGIRSIDSGMRRILPPKHQRIRPAFLELSMDPFDPPDYSRDLRLVDELTSIDADLWSEFQQRFTDPNGVTGAPPLSS